MENCNCEPYAALVSIAICATLITPMVLYSIYIYMKTWINYKQGKEIG